MPILLFQISLREQHEFTRSKTSCLAFLAKNSSFDKNVCNARRVEHNLRFSVQIQRLCRRSAQVKKSVKQRPWFQASATDDPCATLSDFAVIGQLDNRANSCRCQVKLFCSFFLRFSKKGVIVQTIYDQRVSRIIKNKRQVQLFWPLSENRKESLNMRPVCRSIAFATQRSVVV